MRDSDEDAGSAMGTSGTAGTAGASVTSDTERSPGGPGIAGSLGTGGEKERPGTPRDAMPIAVAGNAAGDDTVGEERRSGDVGDIDRGTDETTGRGYRPAESGEDTI
jgi:hypothetical protein